MNMPPALLQAWTWVQTKAGQLVAKIRGSAAEISPESVPFQPDALEIRYQPLPWWGRWGIAWIALFLALGVLWACVGQLDVFVTSMGKVVSRDPTIIMKPLERTVIKSINVEVGETVRQGQTLMTFDPVFSQSDVQRLYHEISALSAQFARLQAEFEGSDFAVAAQDMDDVLWQHSIFVQRRQLYTEKMAYFAEELTRIAQSQQSAEKNLAKQREGLNKSQQVEDMLQRGSSARTASPRELAEFQISRIKMEAEVLSLQGRILELSSEVAARRAERNAFVEEWNKNATEEMVQVRRELVRARNEYSKAVQLESYVTLRAPCDSMVHEIAPVSVGTAVREAEALVTLVPTGGDLEVEAEVAAKDIGKVKVGDSVRVKLLPFPFQQYGTLNGIVRNLSENTFQKQKGEAGEEGEKPQGASFYRARVTLSGTGDGLLKNIRLIPGMEVQAEIQVGQRRIITYLVHPLIKSLDESLREP